jgi:hypothetical protein
MTPLTPGRQVTSTATLTTNSTGPADTREEYLLLAGTGSIEPSGS